MILLCTIDEAKNCKRKFNEHEWVIYYSKRVEKKGMNCNNLLKDSNRLLSKVLETSQLTFFIIIRRNFWQNPLFYGVKVFRF